MEQPTPPEPAASNRVTRNRITLLLVPALVIVALIAFRSQIGGLFGPRVAPPPCGAATLQAASKSFRIQNIASQAQEVVDVPAGKPNIAYWVQGTTVHYVFGLSDTPDNRALVDQFKLGDTVKIAWGDCTSEEFSVASVTPVEAQPSDLLDQSSGGVTIFVPRADSYGGWTVLATRPEALFTAAPSETPDPNAIRTDISFLEQSTSQDGKTLTLKLAIKNTGAKVIQLTRDGISLTSGEGAPAAPSSVDAALPVDIQPGATQTITITFAKPAGNVATFKILDFSVDLYF